MLKTLKRLPIDVGQGEMRHDTAGKKIAFSFVPPATSGLHKAADLGSGDGYWSEQLSSKGYSITSPDKLIGVDFEHGLPYPDNSFAVVWSSEVIEHLHNVDGFIHEINRVLIPGGVAILTTPNSHWWLYYVLRLFGLTPQKVQNQDHKQFFSLASLKAMAPGYDIYGYFPYALIFFRISRGISFLSPTFIMVKKKEN